MLYGSKLEDCKHDKNADLGYFVDTLVQKRLSLAIHNKKTYGTMFCYPKSSNVETAKNLGIALTVMSLITCLGGNLQTNEGKVFR